MWTSKISILTGTTINTNGVTTNNKTYDYDDEAVMTMKTFDEILTEKGYHAEYYGKWHVLTSHSEVYKNQINMLKMVNICLNMEARVICTKII